MAKFKVGLGNDTSRHFADTDIFKHLSEASDSTCKKAVSEGAMILADEVRKRLNAVLAKDEKNRQKRHRKLTGQLQESLGVTNVLKDRNGTWNAKVGFDGYETDDDGWDGRPLPLIARALESGTSRGQPKRPYLRPAVNAVKTRVQETMAKVIEDEYKKKGT